MTGRLIKYEIRSSVKLMAVIWAALIVASLLFSLSGNVLGDTLLGGENSSGLLLSILEFATGLMYFTVFIALIVATIVIVIMRFYKGLLGEEGYLMHTLPVKPWHLIMSKGIVAAGVVLISILVALLSIVILAGISGLSIITDTFTGLIEGLKNDPKFILVVIEILIVLVMSLLKSIYQIYASLAIGQLAGKHRILLSLGAYIGLNIVLTVLFLIIVSVANCFDVDIWLTTLLYDMGDEPLALTQIGLLVLFVGTGIQLVGFHIITERILSLKLNLQ